MLYKSLFLLAFLFSSSRGAAQSYEQEFEVFFAWEVKQVDEFIERFNDDDASFIRKYVQKMSPEVLLTRERLLKSLFNAKGTNWNYQEINAFLKEVMSETSPQYLSFHGDNWFAKVRCHVTYRGHPYQVNVKLKVNSAEDGSTKWVISDVEFPANSRKNGEPKPEVLAVACPHPADSTVSLNPISHAIDFMNIDLATREPENISNFVVDSSGRSSNLNVFIDACLKDQFKINKATAITYYFQQIPGWLIEVRHYNRPSLNSGWLISKLVKLD